MKNPFIKELETQMKKNGSHFWHIEYGKIAEIAKTASVQDCNNFLLEGIEIFCKDDDKTGVFKNALNSCDTLRDNIDGETLHTFVETILENDDNFAHILQHINDFKNLKLETIQLIMDYMPPTEKDEYGNESTKEGRGLGYCCKSNLIAHPAVTQEYMNSLTSERYEECWDYIVSHSTDIETIFKIIKISIKRDGDDGYNTTCDSAVKNPIIDTAHMEAISELGDCGMSAVLQSAKITKQLTKKLAPKAQGHSAGIILRNGRTPLDILEKLVENNNDPDVLKCLAWNRSKKVPASLLVKAFCKIPDHYLYVRAQFLKKQTLVDELARLARLSTGVVPTYVEPEEEVA